MKGKKEWESEPRLRERRGAIYKVGVVSGSSISDDDYSDGATIKVIRYF